MYNIDINKLTALLYYDPANPLVFNSSFFFVFFAIVLFVYAFFKSKDKGKLIFLVFCSFYFYYKTSGLFFLLLLFIATTDFLAGHLIFGAKSIKAKRWLLTASLCMNLGILSYFKYTNFFLDVIHSAFQGPALSFNILLPVGISFFIFQSISYVIDIYRGRIEPLERILDYIFYISFFPQLVAGPIIKAKDFIPQIHKSEILPKETWGEAFCLIVVGLFKKCVISDYISINFVDRVFDAPALYSGVENLFAIYGYAVQIYCDFSGYSDIAIGIALLFGFRFNINFDAPYSSASITEFWRRWHISLSTWLKDYLYISLGGNRKGRIRTYVNLMITMLLGGLWHGASIRFVIWGGLHGLFLVVHKLILKLYPSLPVNGHEMSLTWRIVHTLITFHLVCLAWIFFRAENMTLVGEMFTQLFTNFNVSVFIPFVREYFVILVLIGLGIGLQFIPFDTRSFFKLKIVNGGWMIQTLLLVSLILLITQIKSAELQPFIYFQF